MCKCRVNCMGRGLKCRAERIADGFENVTVVRFNGLAHLRVVTPERDLHRVAMFFPKFCASLDVREEKCDSTSWTINHSSLFFIHSLFGAIRCLRINFAYEIRKILLP